MFYGNLTQYNVEVINEKLESFYFRANKYFRDTFQANYFQTKEESIKYYTNEVKNINFLTADINTSFFIK